MTKMENIAKILSTNTKRQKGRCRRNEKKEGCIDLVRGG